MLLRTIHGSHLYNLATPKSDLDYYTVIPTVPRKRKRNAKQVIHNNIDSMTIDFSTFRVYCDMGVPQALEALFSPVAEVDLIADFRNCYRIDTAATVGRYRRTIKSFSFGEFKQRRHALRLCLNLTEALATGRFNPRLPEEEARIISDVAGWSDDRYFELLERWTNFEGFGA